MFNTKKLLHDWRMLIQLRLYNKWSFVVSQRETDECKHVLHTCCLCRATVTVTVLSKRLYSILPCTSLRACCFIWCSFTIEDNIFALAIIQMRQMIHQYQTFQEVTKFHKYIYPGSAKQLPNSSHASAKIMGSCLS